MRQALSHAFFVVATLNWDILEAGRQGETSWNNYVYILDGLLGTRGPAVEKRASVSRVLLCPWQTNAHHIDVFGYS